MSSALSVDGMFSRAYTRGATLLTLINLPAIAIQEAMIDMDLQLVAQERTTSSSGAKGPLNLYVVPAREQVVRTAQQAVAIDATGTIKLHIVMRQDNALGLDKIQNLLASGAEDRTSGTDQGS
jgi:hypothetical protein